MLFKKLIMVLLVSMLLCSAGGSVSASDVVRGKEGANEVYNPRWSMIIYVTNTLEINNNGNASMTAYISGRSGQVSSIRIISTLQRYQSGSWVNVSSWTRNYPGSSAFWSANQHVSSGYHYRLVNNFHVYGNGAQESTVLVSKIKYY